MPAPSGRVSYYAEYHSNINAIALSLKVPTSGLTCKITPDALDLIPASQTSSDQPHHVTLPSRVFPTKTTLDPSSIQSPLLTLKLAAVPSMASPNTCSLTSLGKSEFPPAPLPASQLQGLNNLACGCCGQPLLATLENSNVTGPIQRVVDLPSEHWQELVDCWMCHEEDFTELREGDLGARSGQALVGGTYLLIHAENVNLSAVVIEQDARIVDMIQVKFHKYMVRFVGQNPATGRALDIPQQRFLSYLAAEIFESARHHATYRFIVQDRVHGREMMLLWMLNWDSTILTNQEPARDATMQWDTSLKPDISTKNNRTSHKARKVMKVLYLKAPSSSLSSPSSSSDLKTLESGLDNTHIDHDHNTSGSDKRADQIHTSKEQSLWDAWRRDPGVERIEFQERLILGLLTVLEQSSSCLPPSQTGASAVLAMDGMRVGAFEV
ncbi:hypothetical protein BG006_011010 [Podila minutissima]|uniref:Uncharacterized protein n=1 Tax=Podila minutissima TaxID=64525 RepID=A0A9P5VHV8_9FUNG|nr:hypothetical protein BG006_011010 [Podila minutissima]